MPARRLHQRLGAVALAALAAFAAATSSASAGVLVASAPSCAAQALSKPFVPWLDYANYTPLRGGNVEDAGASWSLTGGAAAAAGNSTWQVGGAADAHSLSLPAGSSATSSTICVGIEHPTMRFFARRRTGGLLSLSTLQVDVLFESAAGTVLALPIGLVVNGGSWQPTLMMPVVASLLPLLPGQHTPVAFRFTPQGSAAWSIDDVWVDPYGRK